MLHRAAAGPDRGPRRHRGPARRLRRACARGERAGQRALRPFAARSCRRRSHRASARACPRWGRRPDPRSATPTASGAAYRLRRPTPGTPARPRWAALCPLPRRARSLRRLSLRPWPSGGSRPSGVASPGPRLRRRRLPSRSRPRPCPRRPGSSCALPGARAQRAADAGAALHKEDGAAPPPEPTFAEVDAAPITVAEATAPPRLVLAPEPTSTKSPASGKGAAKGGPPSGKGPVSVKGAASGKGPASKGSTSAKSAKAIPAPTATEPSSEGGEGGAGAAAR